MAAERFERVAPPASGRKLRNRAESTGAFLARLWTRFGRPDASEGGFAYGVRDRDSGVEFTAAAGASGPVYRGNDDASTRAALDAFDRWLDAAPLADCSFRDGDERVEWGAAGGVPFEHPVAPPRGALEAALAAAETLDLAAADREAVFEALWALRDARDRDRAAARRAEKRLRRVGVALWEQLLDRFEAAVAEARRQGDTATLSQLYDGDWWQLEQGSDVGPPASLEPRVRVLEQIGASVPRRIQMPGPARFSFRRSRGTSRRPH